MGYFVYMGLLIASLILWVVIALQRGRGDDGA